MTGLLKKGSHVWTAGVKFLKALLLILLYYLLQAAAMPHLKVLGVMPNLNMVAIAVMTVSYGKLYAFIAGAAIGILLETMAMTIPLFYLIIYPVLALLLAQVFADMSDVKREIRRLRESQRQSEAAAEVKASFKPRRLRFRFRRNSSNDLNPHLRILLNASALSLMFEGVMLVYIALVGIRVEFAHLLRALYVMMYTAACCVSMFPARAFLGLYRRRRGPKAGLEQEEGADSREILRKLALVPDEAPQGAGKSFRFLKGKREKKAVKDAAGAEAGPASSPAASEEERGDEDHED